MTSEAAQPLLKLSSILLRCLLGVAVLAIGFAIASALIKTRPEPPARENVSQALIVGTVAATRADIPRQWTGYGTARAMDAVDLAAEVTARVVERPEAIEPGMPLEKGDLVVQLEQTDYLARERAARQSVAQSEADLQALEIDETSWREQLRFAQEQAEIERRELEQATDALQRGAASSAEIDRRTKSLRILETAVSTIEQKLGRLPAERESLRATLERLRADAEVAAQNLQRTTIASPISGVLQRVEVEQGELLAIGSPVARVVNLSRIEVPLKVPASALGYVRVGDGVSLHPDATSAKGWQGVVARIAPEADQATRTLTVFVEVRQDGDAFRASGGEAALLLPGEFVVGAITGAPEPGRTLVPRRAVRDGSVFIAEPNGQAAWAARRLPVTVLFHATGAHPEIDPIERQWAVLENPIPEGTPVIVTNLDELIEGRFVDQRPRVSARAGGTP